MTASSIRRHVIRLLTSCRNRRPFLRPSLEQLEDRLAPALFTVNSLADTSVIDGSNSSGLLTLRDAIAVENGTLAIANLSLSEQAQISGTLNATGGDTIQFAPAIAGQTINLTAFDDTSFGNSAFLVNSLLTIQGDPTLGSTIARDTNAADYPGGQLLDFRLFDVASTGNLTLSNVTLANGLAQGGDGGSQASAGAGGGGAGLGGAVFNDGGSFTTVACTFTNNTAQGGQGGMLSGTPVDGGGVGAGGGGTGSSDAGPYGGGTIAGDQNSDSPFNQAGSAFTAMPVDISSFSTQFAFQLLPLNPSGNDDIGITFTLQGTGPTALGANNIYLGAYPIANSVSVEFNIGAPWWEGGYGNSGNSTNWISPDISCYTAF